MPSSVRRIKRASRDDQLTVVEHLTELRNRLIVAGASVGVAFVVGYIIHGRLLNLMYEKLPANVDRPTTLGVGEPFSIALKTALYFALLVALPILFYQLYAFVIPAFSDDIGKALWPLLILVPALFLVGVLFGYFVVLHPALKFLLGFDNDLYNTQVRAGQYISFVGMLMLALGLVFELPAALMLAGRIGLVNARFLRKNRRYAILILTIVAAALPSIDPVSMLLELVPLLILYEISIFLVQWVEPKRRAAESVDSPPGTIPQA
jgi:sec-independent protein translocase protein TatC